MALRDGPQTPTGPLYSRQRTGFLSSPSHSTRYSVVHTLSFRSHVYSFTLTCEPVHGRGSFAIGTLISRWSGTEYRFTSTVHYCHADSQKSQLIPRWSNGSLSPPFPASTWISLLPPLPPSRFYPISLFPPQKRSQHLPFYPPHPPPPFSPPLFLSPSLPPSGTPPCPSWCWSLDSFWGSPLQFLYMPL